MYTYDHVVGENSSQEDIFNLVGKPITYYCLNGNIYNLNKKIKIKIILLHKKGIMRVFLLMGRPEQAKLILCKENLQKMKHFLSKSMLDCNLECLIIYTTLQINKIMMNKVKKKLNIL